ncbi:MAG TPA: hypothetical protein DHV79_10915 [Lachnospiraceae bacterium]|nr:hypothetical protein [Lachnospiraceae bacterium]
MCFHKGGTRMESPVLLIYHMQQPRQAALEAVCAAMKIRSVIVSDGDGRVPVGLLTRSENPIRVIREAERRGTFEGVIDEEMIIMAGFDDALLTSFLSTLREQGLVIALKAIETDENRYWNGEMLQDELKKERESFRGR